MNKYFKKFSIMFVMTLILMLGSCVSAFATETTESIKINSTTLNFNKVIYIDANNGDDANGNGGFKTPFKSIKKGMDFLSSNSAYRTNCAIVLKKGSYDITNCVQGYSSNLNPEYNGMKVSWIAMKGDEGKTFINSNNGFEVMEIENNSSYRIKMCFYGLIFKNINNELFHLGGDDWTNEYYNCVFDNDAVGGWNGVVGNANIIVKNCLFVNCSEIYSGNRISGKCINTITTNNFIQPINGTQTSVLYDGKVDENYNITSDGWKSVGDGTNPDGTQANIGVYGGEFAWGESYNGSLTLDKSTMNLNEGGLGQITATINPASMGVSWTTSDSSIATVDSIGKVTALREGTCTITAATNNSLIATCTVTVTKQNSTSSSGTATVNSGETNSYGILNMNTPSGFTQNNNNGGNGNSSNNSNNTNNSGNSGNNYSNNNNSNSNNNYYYYNNYYLSFNTKA